MKEVDTPIGKYRCPQWLISRTFWMLLFCIAVFAVLLVVPIMEAPEQQNCLAMVVFVSMLWATEVSRAVDVPPESIDQDRQYHSSSRHYLSRSLR